MLHRRIRAGAIAHARDQPTREANQNFSQAIAAAERGEIPVVARNGRPVAKIAPHSQDRGSDPEWQASFAALEESLRSKRGSSRLVGTIAEDDKYGEDPA
jgi:antitoxin (DNA-binding transcriptional repressor) of toxin-antitoxin stability system